MLLAASRRAQQLTKVADLQGVARGAGHALEEIGVRPWISAAERAAMIEEPAISHEVLQQMSARRAARAASRVPVTHPILPGGIGPPITHAEAHGPTLVAGMPKAAPPGAATVPGRTPILSPMTKHAILGGLAHLTGKGITLAGKGLVTALKDPVGRKVLGSGAIIGGMGGAGFMRGAQADRPEAPENLNGAE